MDHYETEAEIEAVVQGFESCATAKEDFKHSSHLTVAVWYLRDSSSSAALERMRVGLHRFLDHHGVGRQKYHETLTVFWLKLVRSVTDQMKDVGSLVDTTNLVLERFADPRVVFEYYSEPLLSSAEARGNWVEPDLKGI